MVEHSFKAFVVGLIPHDLILSVVVAVVPTSTGLIRYMLLKVSSDSGLGWYHFADKKAPKAIPLATPFPGSNVTPKLV